jgi:hypothetical protein
MCSVNCVQIDIDTVGRRNNASSKLRTARQGNVDLESETTFIVEFPDAKAHENHVIGEVIVVFDKFFMLNTN